MSINTMAGIVLLGGLIAIIISLQFSTESDSALLLPNADAKAKNHLKKLPDFSKIKVVKEKKEAFFNTLYPIVEEENKRVLKVRRVINELKSLPVEELSDVQISWLSEVSTTYKVPLNTIDEDMFVQLLQKVDYIPPSLALTQAAIESGWGSSRFTKKGNNLFGQWCFKKGCGMVPSSRDSEKTHEVAKFSSVNHSVRAYIRNLNSNDSFLELRKKRAMLRDGKKPITGILLAKTLTLYSEEGGRYITKVSKFIKQNKLQRFTNKFEKTMLVASN